MFVFELAIDKSRFLPPYDHLHHGEYLSLYERSREAFLEHIGMPLSEFIEEGVLIVVTKATVEYLRELRCDRVSVTCDGVDVDEARKRIAVRQRILSDVGKVVSRAEVELAFMSGALRRALPVPRRIIEATPRMG